MEGRYSTDISSLYEKVMESAKAIAEELPFAADLCSGAIGIILGSGLGSLADHIRDGKVLPYSGIPHFPAPTVRGHEGKLIAGFLGEKPVLVMKGRFHYYEGNDMETVVFPIRVMAQLGLRNLLVTNAAGGINPDFRPGDLMLITDHIKFFTQSPLRGPLLTEGDTRFPDMSEAYTPVLRKMARDTAAQLGMTLREGVYFYMAGPQYETPAEVRACRILGGDAVGMSTVPEVIAASAAGMRVLGISCITNMAAGISSRPLTHHEVMETAEKVHKDFIRLVKAMVANWV